MISHISPNAGFRATLISLNMSVKEIRDRVLRLLNIDEAEISISISANDISIYVSSHNTEASMLCIKANTFVMLLGANIVAIDAREFATDWHTVDAEDIPETVKALTHRAQRMLAKAHKLHPCVELETAKSNTLVAFRELVARLGRSTNEPTHTFSVQNKETQ